MLEFGFRDMLNKNIVLVSISYVKNKIKGYSFYMHSDMVTGNVMKIWKSCGIESNMTKQTVSF